MAAARNHSSLTEKHAFMILNALPMVGSVLCQRLLERLSVNEIAESIHQNISTTNVLMIQLELKHYVKKAIDGKYEA